MLLNSQPGDERANEEIPRLFKGRLESTQKSKSRERSLSHLKAKEYRGGNRDTSWVRPIPLTPWEGKRELLQAEWYSGEFMGEKSPRLPGPKPKLVKTGKKRVQTGGGTAKVYSQERDTGLGTVPARS